MRSRAIWSLVASVFGAFVLIVSTAEVAQSQDEVPCAAQDVTCGGGEEDEGGEGQCRTSYNWACSSCPTAGICEIIPSLCTTPFPGREGTRIKSTRCPGQATVEEWSDAPCGYCAR
jgi:hypothetical protein